MHVAGDVGIWQFASSCLAVIDGEMRYDGSVTLEDSVYPVAVINAPLLGKRPSDGDCTLTCYGMEVYQLAEP